MVQFIPPPDYRRLLPPFLACLPAAFASPRPPPALLPLLSPILRQRVQLLSATASSPEESWLRLLSWKSEEADKVARVVESDIFELHPVSGEVDFGDIEPIKYRRLDEETLQAILRISVLSLAVQYLWCQGDEDGGGDGWRVSDLASFEEHKDIEKDTWFPTIEAAEEEEAEDVKALASTDHGEIPAGSTLLATQSAMDINQNSADADDAKYWSQYDDILERSPRPVYSRAESRNLDNSLRGIASESEYFARYGQVQPEMDNDDPLEDHSAMGEFTLNGDMMTASRQQATCGHTYASQAERKLENSQGRDGSAISHPRTSSPSAAPVAVSRLEESAAAQSVYEVIIRQHVSTTIKSLFRLTRGAGLDREEFNELVRTELDTLGMMSDDS